MRRVRWRVGKKNPNGTLFHPDKKIIVQKTAIHQYNNNILYYIIYLHLQCWVLHENKSRDDDGRGR